MRADALSRGRTVQDQLRCRPGDLPNPPGPYRARALCRHCRAGGAGAGEQLLSRDHLRALPRSEEHTSELQSLMRISYAVFCLKKKNIKTYNNTTTYLIPQ